MTTTSADRPPISPIRRVVDAAGSLIAVTAILAGIPLLLWHLVGWPLPTQVPSLDGITHALSSEVSDRFLIDTLAVTAWTIWALLCWSLLAEIVATARQTRTPGRFRGPFHALATRLVASLSMLVVSGLPNPAVASAATPAIAQPLAPTPPPATPGPAPSATTTVSPSSPTLVTYTVQRRDSLWSIAEHQLGDGLRWREIWDLNHGRDFGGFRFDNPNRLFSGWQLTLPIPAPSSPQVSAPAAPPTASPATTTPATRVEPSCDGPAATTPAPTTSATTTTAAPSPPDNDAPATTTDVPPTGDVTRSGTRQQSSETASSPDTGSASTAVPVLAAGVAVAAGLLALVQRLRRSQARRRQPGQPPHVPPAATAEIEVAVRRTAAPERIRRLHAALASFASGVGGPVPSLVAARVGRSDMELLLDAAMDDAPAGFVDTGAGRAFTTEPDLSTAALDALGGDAVNPWPAIVSAGALGEDVVMIDVESAPGLCVTGDDAADHVRRIATELATSPTAALVDLIVVDDEFDLAGSESIRLLATADDAISILEQAGAATASALEQLGAANTVTARCDHVMAQSWGVTVFVSLRPLNDDQMARLSRALRPNCGTAAVVAATAPADGWWHLASGPSCRLDPQGFDLAPLPLSADDFDRIDELVTDAAVGDAGRIDLDDANETDPETHVTEIVDGCEATGSDVEVRVLGPIDVVGAAPISRKRSVEVIVYLALHRRGVSTDQLKTAIWPDSAPSQATFNVTVHRARAALGVGPDDQHHLPHAVARDGRYGVGPGVATDLDRFVSLVRDAKDADEPGTEIELLHAALDLVRGAPFEGVVGYEWAFTEGYVVEAEATIADTAHRLAQLALQRGNATEAMWAAARGLLAVPGSEPLYRDRMEAAHLQGDPAAVDRIVEELIRYVETSDPLDDLHPDTIALWRRYGRSRSAATGGD